MKDYLPFVGDTRAVRAWDKLFSRDMLGGILVGGAVGKTVEKSLNLFFDTTLSLLFAYAAASIFFVVVFVYWHRVEQAVEEATD